MTRGAHCQDPRRIAGRCDAAIDDAALRIVSVIAAGRDYHDARLHETLRRTCQRIVGVRFVHTRCDGHVDDADIQRRFVHEDVVHRGDDVADASGAGAIERFEDDQARVRCDAGSSAARVHTVAGNDAGDMRPVTVVVVRRVAPVDEIDKRVDALQTPAAGQIVVPCRDTRIDDGDANTGSVVAELLSDRRRPDRRARAFQRADDDSVERDVRDMRIVRQTEQRRIRHVGDVRVDDRQRTPTPAAGAVDVVGYVRKVCGVRRRDDHTRGTDGERCPPRGHRAHLLTWLGERRSGRRENSQQRG